MLPQLESFGKVIARAQTRRDCDSACPR
jgi:hypothetical protein